MIGSKRYIPILKWKRAEQGALKFLSNQYKQMITPLIQFVMPQNKPHENLEDIVNRFEDEAIEIPKIIIESWGILPIFIDVSLLFTTELKAKTLYMIAKSGYDLGSIFIPVIHIDEDPAIKKIAYKIAGDTGSGMCLRIICPDFYNMSELNENISEIVSRSKIKDRSIDLLVDIKEIKDNGNKYTNYFNLSQNIYNLSNWRTFTFSGGAFPEDLSQCKLDEDNLIPRIEWKRWKELTSKKGLQRVPAFSDYTIQYPIYQYSTQFFAPTTSIKYTLEEEWFIMKGQKQKFDKYLASAALLVNDKRYYGEYFSFGDKYIAQKGKHFESYIRNPEIGGTGSTETWLRAGINHHITLVAYQISSLP